MSNELTPATPRSLYHIADDLSAFFETRDMLTTEADAATDHDAKAAALAGLAEVQQSIERLGAELATKTDNTAGVLARMETEEQHLKSEAERIARRRRTFEAARKWLSGYVVSVMQQQGIRQLKTPDNTLFLRPSEAVLITNPVAVPDQYKTVIVKTVMPAWRLILERCGFDGPFEVEEFICKTPIKKAIKAGETVPGADLECRETLCRR